MTKYTEDQVSNLKPDPLFCTNDSAGEKYTLNANAPENQTVYNEIIKTKEAAKNGKVQFMY